MPCSTPDPIYPCDTAGFDLTLLGELTDAAWEYLHAVSGGTVGACVATERYVVPETSVCYNRAAPDGYVQDDRRDCCKIVLESPFPQSITSVKIDGVAVDPSDYTLAGSTLISLGSCWPRQQDCAEPGVEVTYVWGKPVTVLGLMALGELSCDFYAGATGSTCRMSSRAVSVSRQGVQIDMESAMDLVKEGLTGLPMVDSFIRTFNPNRLTVPSRVLSPDLPVRA